MNLGAVQDWLPGIISTLLGGGIVASIVALYKVRPEAGQIVVTAAQGALLVQTGVIDNLQKEIVRLNAEIQTLKLENEALRMHLDKMEKDQIRHDLEIKVLAKNDNK